MSLQRMPERRDLPPANMRGKKQHALAARDRTLEVLEAVVDHHLADVLASVFRKQAHLGELTSERSEFTAQDLGPFVVAFFRKGQSQIAHADPAQLHMENI